MTTTPAKTTEAPARCNGPLAESRYQRSVRSWTTGLTALRAVLTCSTKWHPHFSFQSERLTPVDTTTWSNGSMGDVDDYIEKLAEPARTTLTQLRACLVELLPQAEQCLAYGAPAFRVRGKAVAGFSASKNHLSYLPHSGEVLQALAQDVSEYATSKGALRFATDAPLPATLVAKLVHARLQELGFDQS